MNKAKIEREPVDRYIISSAQVQSYLENELGFGIGADFLRWDGISANHASVRMRVGLLDKDIGVPQTAATSYAAKIIAENSAGRSVKSTVLDVLKKYMYPTDLRPLFENRETVENMLMYGVYDNRIREISEFSNLTLVPAQGMWRVYLMPQLILEDMLSDPSTGEVDGHFAITGVFGRTNDTIRWEIEISKNKRGNTETGRVDVEKLFTTK